MAHKKYNNNTLFFNVTLTSKCCSPPSPSACHSPLSLSRFLLAADWSKNLIFEEVKSKERTLRDVPNTCVHTLYPSVSVCTVAHCTTVVYTDEIIKYICSAPLTRTVTLALYDVRSISWLLTRSSSRSYSHSLSH